MPNKLEPLPASSDEYWAGAETHHPVPVKVGLCPGEHFLVQDGNTATCNRCPYGSLLPGYQRCLGGKVIDLRDGARED